MANTGVGLSFCHFFSYTVAAIDTGDIPASIRSVSVDNTSTNYTYRLLIPSGTVEFLGSTEASQESIFNRNYKIKGDPAGGSTIPAYGLLQPPTEDDPLTIAASLLLNRKISVEKKFEEPGQETSTLKYIGSEYDSGTPFRPPEYGLFGIEYFLPTAEQPAPVWGQWRRRPILDKARCFQFWRGCFNIPPYLWSIEHKPIPMLYTILAGLKSDNCLLPGKNRFGVRYSVKLSDPSTKLNRTDW